MSDARVSEKLPDWVKDHVRRYLASNGADGHMITLPNSPAPVPTLLLTTTGRRSGEKFLFPLIYGTTGNGYAIIASKGGAPEHPGWYRNLVADPMVEIQVGDKHLRAKARTVTDAGERARIWQQMAAIFPPYDDYAKKAAGREIPVVVLDPLPTA